MSKEEEYNRGEKDQRNSEKHPVGVFDFISGNMHYKPGKDKESYDKGWENAKRQSKR